MVEAKIDTDKKIFFVVALFLIVFGIGRAYAYFSGRSETSTQTVNTATYDLETSNNAILRSQNIVPISSSEVTTKATEMGFKVTNNSTGSIIGEISITNITMSKSMDDEYFKWALYSDGEKIKDGSFYNLENKVEIDDNYTIDKLVILDNISMNKDDINEYKLYVWIEDSGNPQNELQNSSFEGRITFDAVQG